MEEFTLTFDEAMKKVVEENAKIVGDNFRIGYYASLTEDGIVGVFSDRVFQNNLMLTRGVYQQKFKVIEI